jgi:membrane-bound lytic murein transglycosylase D
MVKSLFLLTILSLISSCAHHSAITNSETADTDEDRDEDAENVEGTPEDVNVVAHSSQRNKDEIEADLLAQSTFPLVYNEFVEAWVQYFTVNRKGRETFSKWLSRSTRYIPLMKKVLKENGLPEDLIYLSMIESGFNTKAYSRAKAVGLWQFMKGTGQRYGLKIDYWIDERRDIVKATEAAAKYLNELHMIFGSWYLAAASYNAGEGRVLNAVRKEKTRNFWELSREKGNFRKETSNYVPKMIAAALIAKNPEKYGFTDTVYEPVLYWDTVDVPPGVDLRSVAEQAGCSEEVIKILNSELRIGITPPDQTEPYTIRIPVEYKNNLISNLDKLRARKSSHFIVHNIESGENLGSIARRFKTQVQTIMDLNDIRSAKRLRVGQKIRVPIPSYAQASDEEMGSRRKKQSRRSIAQVDSESDNPRDNTGVRQHVVKRGETLSSIAKRYDMSIDSLLKLNNLQSASSLRAGARIRLD